ncbi:F-box only protein 17 isoform X1 [Mustela lutreola]|uniref:F-box only protein 17 isoform X1 n=2 Tax=Mustela lutreola TaxID=9666 RepID=UPI0027974F81|nr:F-box only protein 17 isoform X1 [Mustela lutreola]
MASYRPQLSQPRKSLACLLEVTGSPGNRGPGSHRSGRSWAPHAHQQPPSLRPTRRGVGRGIQKGLVRRSGYVQADHQVSALTGLWRPEMGARPSRRQLPADPPLALDALPPELLVQVLSHVPPRALVTRCRAVCRAWRDVVDGPTVWLLQLARDRSAEGRALYAVAQRCPPNGEDEEFPLCALARYCLRAPLGRNLIFNSCGEQGFRGWEVEHGGNGWAVEKNLTLVPGAPSQTCFVTSFQWCFKRQLVDLVMEGVWQELLDSAQIEICVADWWGARENCGCIYRLRVRLLDVYENEVVKFSASPNPVLQWTERGCRQVSHVFTNFGKGIRYVSFEQYGRDTRSWVGHYGALVTHSSVRVRIRLS